MTAPTTTDYSSVTATSGATSYTWSHTVSAGAKMKIRVYVGTRRNNTTPGAVTSVTWGNQALYLVTDAHGTSAALTQLDSSPSNICFRVEIWEGLTAQAGTGTITVTLDQGATRFIGMGQTIKATYMARPQVLLTGGTVTDASTTPFSITPTTETTNSLVSAFFMIPSGSGTTMTATTGTNRINVSTGSGATADCHAVLNTITKAAAGAQAMTTTQSANAAQIIGITIVDAEPKPLPVVNPWISGAPVVGETLTARVGAYVQESNSNVVKFYQNTTSTLLATASTYVVQITDIGQQILIGVTPSATGFSATGAEVTSALTGVVVAAATTYCQVIDPPPKKVFQRTLTAGLGGTTGSVPITGRYLGVTTPTTVECRIMQSGAQIVGWTALVSPTISGGNISGTILNVPQGMTYNVEMRTKDNLGVLLSTSVGVNTWGVGPVILWAGSSTPEKAADMYDDDGTSAVDSRLSAYLIVRDGAGAFLSGSWQPMPPAAGFLGAANYLLAQLPAGVPLGFIQTSDGGTKLHIAAGGGWDDVTAQPWTNMVTALADATSSLNQAEAVFSKIDSLAKGGVLPASAANEVTYTQTLHANLRTLVNANLRIYLTINPGLPGFTAGDDPYVTFARWAQSLMADVALTYAPLNGIGILTGPDGIHPTAAEQRREWKWPSRALSVNQWGQAADWRAPRPSLTVSDTYDSSTGYYVMTFEIFGGTGILGKAGTTTGLTGFEISDDSFATTKAITDARIVSAHKVRLTTNTALVTPQCRYMYGHSPDTTNCVCDNASEP